MKIAKIRTNSWIQLIINNWLANVNVIDKVCPIITVAFPRFRVHSKFSSSLALPSVSRIGNRLIDETRKEGNGNICFRWIILRTYRITYRRRLWSCSRRPEGCLRPWECKDHSIHKLVSHCPHPYAYKPLHQLAFTRLRCVSLTRNALKRVLTLCLSDKDFDFLARSSCFFEEENVIVWTHKLDRSRYSTLIRYIYLSLVTHGRRCVITWENR